MAWEQVHAVLGSPLCRAVTPAEKRLVAHNWQCPPVLQQEQPEPLSRSEEAFKQSMNFKRLDENVSKYIALRCLISAAFTGGKEFVRSLQKMEATPPSATKSACNGNLPLPTFLAGC